MQSDIVCSRQRGYNIPHCQRRFDYHILGRLTKTSFVFTTKHIIHRKRTIYVSILMLDAMQHGRRNISNCKLRFRTFRLIIWRIHVRSGALICWLWLLTLSATRIVLTMMQRVTMLHTNNDPKSYLFHTNKRIQ